MNAANQTECWSYNCYLTVTMAEAQDLHHSTASHAGGFEDEESLSPLEQEVLDEYARLLGNLNNVRAVRCSYSYHRVNSFLTHCLATHWSFTYPAPDERIAGRAV